MGIKEGGNATDRKVVFKEEDKKTKSFNRNRDRRNIDGDSKGGAPRKEKFQGACAKFTGHVFEAGSSRLIQIASYTITMEHMNIYVGQKYDPVVLAAFKKMQDISLSEPTAVTVPDGMMTEVEKIKYSKKFDRYFVNQERIDKEKKQVYALFYGQMDKYMKTCLAEHNDWDKVHQKKDLIRLLKMLRNVNFTYRSNQEPVLSMWVAKNDFIKL